MKGLIGLLTAAAFLCFGMTCDPPDRTWRAITTDGFGNPAEEGFWDMKNVDGTLFMISWNSDEGGSVYRDFVTISNQGFGNSENWALVGLEWFKNCLYVSTWNNNEGGEVWRSCDAMDPVPTWSQVADAGFGNPAHYTGGTHLVEWDGWIYAGTFNPLEQLPNGPKIMRSETGDLGTWEQFGVDNFDLGDAISDATVGHVFAGDDGYYVGVEVQPIGNPKVGTKKGCIVLKADPVTQDWALANDRGFAPLPAGNPLNLACTDIDQYFSSSGGVGTTWLYAGTWNPLGAQMWRTSTPTDPTSWTSVTADGFGVGGDNWFLWDITPFGSEMFVAGWGKWTTDGQNSPLEFSRGTTVLTATGGWLYQSNDGVNFVAIAPPGGFGFPQVGVNRAVVHESDVYVLTQSWGFPGQVWVYED